MKKLFTLVCGMMLALSANAALELDMSNLTNGWGSSYDSDTKTISYEAEAWGGRGWGLSTMGGEMFDYSDYDYVVVQIASATVKPKVVVEFTDGVVVKDENGNDKYKTKESKEAVGSLADTYLAVPLVSNLDYLDQIYIQNFTWQSEKPNNPAGTITLVKAFLCTESEFNAFLEANKPSSCWEGSNDFGTTWKWEDRVEISKNPFATVKEGDILKFTYTEDSSLSYWQLKLVSNDNVLEGCKAEVNEYGCVTMGEGATTYSVKLTASDVETLKANGLLIQGYGVTLTKVEIVEGGATGISNATVATPVAKTSKIYNLAGQQVSESYKGVVIKNGKKFVQK